MPDNQNPTATITTSKQFTLHWRDAIQSLLYAAIGAVASPLYTYLESNNFQFNLKDMWHVALMALVTAILRKFIKPSQTIVKITPALTETQTDDGGDPPPPPPPEGTEIPTKPPPTP